MSSLSRVSKRRSRRRSRSTSSAKLRRTLALQSLESRQMLDGYGIRFAFAPVSNPSAEVSSLQAGESYVMKTFVQDQRPVESATIPSGIRQAVFDLTFDQSLLSFSGPISLGSEFSAIPGRENTGVIEPGKIDNLNARDVTQPSQAEAADEYLAFEINVMALAQGTASLAVSPANEPNLFAQFHRPLPQVTDFDVAGNVISILGGGISFSDADSVAVTEGSTSDSFQVALTTAPTSDVTLNFTATQSDQISLSTNSLTFTPANWDSAQSVQVTALDDSIDEDNMSVSIVFDDAISSDPVYSGLDVSDVSVAITDNDDAGLVINPTFGLIVNEDGTQRSSQLRLTSEPTSPVTINLSSSDTGEVTVSPSTLTFTASNWDVDQSITMTGVADDVIDGLQNVTITAAITSADNKYQSIVDQTLTAMNQDTDVAMLLVQPNAGLETSEDAQADVFNVRLNLRPASNVVLDVTSSDVTEGAVSTAQLTFTPDNWDQVQNVTVTGVDDDLTDGAVAYEVVVAPNVVSDAAFRNVPAATVMLTNFDNDVAGLVVTPPNNVTTTEAGGSVSGAVRLQTQPTGTVTVTVTASDSSEASIQPETLTFNETNWDSDQSITIAGLDDVVSDGDVAYQVTLASTSNSDSQYQGLVSQPISLTNLDDDIPGVTLSGVDNLATNEQGLTDQFTVVLQTQPVGNVTISLASDDTDEVLVSPASLDFTPSNWDTPQSVTVTGVNDNIVDGPQTAMISFDLSSSADAQYQAVSVAPVSVSNQGDVAGLLIQPNAGLLTGEDGQFDSFSVRLTKMPTSNVTLTLESTDETEGVPSVSQLVFTPQNFNVLQQVTVTGVNDQEADGFVDYQVRLTPTNDSDAEYRALPASTVLLSNIDDDVADLIVTTPSDLTTSESGDSVSIPIRLQTQPSGNVSVSAQTSDSTEGQVSTNPLIFTPSNWDQTQNAVVVGLDDVSVDGDVAFEVTFTTSSAVDLDYDAGISKSITLSNEDDDVPGVIVSPQTTLQVSETGSAATFNLVLATRPLQNVTLRPSSNDATEGSVSPNLLVFTPANFDQPQNVVVTGVDDDLVDGRVGFNVDFVLESDDAVYDGLTVDPVAVENQSDDEGSIQLINANDLIVDESGTMASFGVVLSEQPGADVVLPLAIDDGSEISISTNQLVFTAQNWNVPQNVVVTGAADGLVDADQVSNVRIGPSQSSDSLFDELTIGDVSVTNENVDTASITVTVVDVNEGSGDASSEIIFSLTLDGPVESGFSLGYQTVDPTSGIVADAGSDYQSATGTLAFDGTDSQTQNVSVSIIADSIVEANEQLGVVLNSLSISDNSIDPQAISFPVVPNIARILNDDSATLSLMSDQPAVFEGAAGEQGSLQSKIVLSSAVQGGVTVSYSTADGTATVSDGDYIASSDVLTFVGNQGEEQTVSVAVNGDDDAEPDEQFSLALSQVQTLDSVIRDSITIVGSPSSLTIRNDDAPQLILRQVDSSSSEGSVGATQTLRFEVELTDNVNDADGFVVPIATFDQTATVASGDYAALDSSLSFVGTAGETQTFEVTLNGDDVVEDDETFEVRLGDLIGLDAAAELIVTSPSVIASIANDDQASLQLVASQTSVSEGDDGESMVTLTVQLNGQVDEAFTVVVASEDGTATIAGGDYTAIDQTLAFTGDTGQTQTVVVAIRGDEIVETNEQFAVLLSELGGLSDSKIAAVSLPTSATSIEILADDRATLTLSGDVATAEGAVGNDALLPFSVVLSHALPSTFQLGFQTVDGTAIAGTDYSANSGLISFAGNAGETQTIDVSVIGESLVERDETFAFELLDVTGLPDGLRAFVDLTTISAQGTISNDDTATISLLGPAQVSEPGAASESASLEYIVTLSAPVQGGVEVGFQTQDDTATQADYQAVSGSLVFENDSVLSQTFTVTVLGDNVLESQESFLVELTGLMGGDPQLASSISLQNQSLRTNIIDDDAVTVRFGELSSSAAETGGAHFVDVVLETTGGATLSEPVVVNVAVQDQGTTSSGDFVLATSQVVFAAGSGNGAIQRVQINVANDRVFEPTETVSIALSLSGGSSGAISVGDASHTVSITDDPMNGVLSGRVWADTDRDGLNEDHEIGIAGVVVKLTGASSQGESVERETVSDALGRYSFANLAAGTYSITQVQPDSYHNGTSNARTQIVLGASEQQADLDFGENGLKASAISLGTFTARSVRPQSTSASAGLAISDSVPAITFSGNVQLNQRTSIVDSLFANWIQ